MSYLDSYIASNRSRVENSKIAAEQAKTEAETILQETKDERTSAVSEIQSEKELAISNFTENFKDFVGSSAGVNLDYVSLVVNQLPPDYVDNTGLPYGQYSKGDNIYQTVYWDFNEGLWKDLGAAIPSKEYVDLAVSSGSTLSSVIDFQNLIPTPEEKSKGTVVKNLVSFHEGLGIGGGLFYWNENKSTAHHDGGLTTIDPGWNNGTFGDIQDSNWFLRDPNNSVNVNASESLQIKGVWERVNIDYVYPEFGGAIPDPEVLPKDRVEYDEDGDEIISASIPNTFNPALVTDNTVVIQAAVNSPYPLRLTSNAYYISDTIILNSPKTIVGSGAVSKPDQYKARDTLPFISSGVSKYETYKNVASFIYTDQDINILDLKAHNITLKDFGIDTSWVYMDISGDWEESDRKAAIIYYVDEPMSKHLIDNIHIYGNEEDLEDHVHLGRYGVLIEETQPSIDLVEQSNEQQQAYLGWITMKAVFNLSCWNLHTAFKVTPKVWPLDPFLGIIPTFSNSFVCDILADNIKRCFDVNTITAGGMSVFKAYLQARPIVHVATAISELGLTDTGGTNSQNQPTPYIDWPFNIIRHEGSEVDIYAWDLNNPIDPFVNDEGQFRPAIAFDIKSKNTFLGPYSKTMINTGRVLPDNIRLLNHTETGVDFPFRTHNTRNFWSKSGMIHTIHNALHAANKRYNISIKDYKANDATYFDTFEETTSQLTSGLSGYTINNENNLFAIGLPVTEVVLKKENANNFDKDLSFVEIVVDLGAEIPIWNIWTSIDTINAKPKRIDLFTVDSSGNTVRSKSYSQEYNNEFYVGREGGVDFHKTVETYSRAIGGSTEFYLNNGNNHFQKFIIRIIGLGNNNLSNQDTTIYINSLIGDKFNPSAFDYGTILTNGDQRIYGDLTVDNIKYPAGSTTHPQTKYLSFELNNDNVPNLGTPVTLFTNSKPAIIKSVYIRKFGSVSPYAENPILSLYSLVNPSYNIFDIDLNNLPVEGKYLDISEYFIHGGLQFGSKTGDPDGGDISNRILVYIEYVDFSDISEPNYTL